MSDSANNATAALDDAIAIAKKNFAEAAFERYLAWALYRRGCTVPREERTVEVGTYEFALGPASSQDERAKEVLESLANVVAMQRRMHR